MNNIYLTIYDIYKRIYTSKDNTHIRLNPELRDYLYIKHGITIGEAERCYIKAKIDCTGGEIPVDIIYLNEEQTEQWKTNGEYDPLDLVETYIGRYDIHLIIYVPDFTMYINNEYKPMKRLADLSTTIYMILDAYFRSNMILDIDIYRTTIYGALTIALKVLFDFDICTKEDFADKEINVKGLDIVFKDLKDLDSTSITDLLINKTYGSCFSEK